MNPTNDAKQAYAAAAQPTAADSGPMGWTPPDFQDFATDLALSHPHYRVTGFISNGGMGAVYRAEGTDEKGKTSPLVIKMLRPGFLSDPRDLARFQREIDILSSLSLKKNDSSPDYRHIVPILDHGETEGGHHFFVMPYMGERTLAVYTTGRRLPTQRVLPLMQQLCAAVDYIHQKGIIHRDLKPSNILLADPDERALILDFGVARARIPVDDLGTLSRPGDKPGTHGYMAPERAAGGESAQPADIYSVGVIFYQLITGEILQGYPRPLSEFDHRLDSRFDAILAKALHQDPTQRYQTAMAFAEALTNTQAPTTAAASTSPTHLQSQSKNTYYLIGFALTLLTGLIVWNQTKKTTIANSFGSRTEYSSVAPSMHGDENQSVVNQNSVTSLSPEPNRSISPTDLMSPVDLNEIRWKHEAENNQLIAAALREFYDNAQSGSKTQWPNPVGRYFNTSKVSGSDMSGDYVIHQGGEMRLGGCSDSSPAEGKIDSRLFVRLYQYTQVGRLVYAYQKARDRLSWDIYLIDSSTGGLLHLQPDGGRTIFRKRDFQDYLKAPPPVSAPTTHSSALTPTGWYRQAERVDGMTDWEAVGNGGPLMLHFELKGVCHTKRVVPESVAECSWFQIGNVVITRQKADEFKSYLIEAVPGNIGNATRLWGFYKEVNETPLNGISSN
jgi:serine/threonine protein kinase